MDEGVREAFDLLKEVRDYHNGFGKYDFSNIIDDYNKTNAQFDAWIDIESRIEIFLKINGEHD